MPGIKTYTIRIPFSEVERTERRAGGTTPGRAAARRALHSKLRPRKGQTPKAAEPTQSYHVAFETGELDTLRRRAKLCGLSVREFLTRCLLGRELWLAPGVKPPSKPAAPKPAAAKPAPAAPTQSPPDWHPPEGVQIDALDGDLRVVTPRHEGFRVGVRELGGEWSRDVGRWILRPDQRVAVQTLIDEHFRQPRRNQ